MRVALVVVAACGGATPAPTPIASSTATCSEAAVGLEQATRGVRAPESSIMLAMRARCSDDRWPATAIECFAKMHEGDLGKCARILPDDARKHLFGTLGGDQDDRMQIVLARARLEGVEVGVPICNRFVAAVASVLTCDAMPLDKRVILGNETADFWDLPTHGLPEDAQRRMSNACGASLAELQAQAESFGCML
jgi:hypothetical protein